MFRHWGLENSWRAVAQARNSGISLRIFLEGSRGGVNSLLEKSVLLKLQGPASIWEHQKNVKLRQKQFHIKDTGKSSSRKLRYVMYYILYRMDPQKTHYKNIFSAKMSTIENCFFSSINSPPNSRSTAPLRRLFMLININSLSPPIPGAIPT